MNELTVYEFQPLWLTLDRVGPFRSTPYEIDFTDSDDRPCNIFLLMSQNGRGKTTVLDCMSLLMGLLGEEKPAWFGHEDLDRGEGRIQLDVLTRVHWRGSDRRVVLSVVAGVIDEETVLKDWPADRLAKYGAQQWHVTGFRRRAPGLLAPLGRGDELGEELRATLANSRELAPSAYADSMIALPTALYFSAYRDIPPLTDRERTIVQPQHWGYHPLHRFGAHGTGWTDSLDNLLVWLKWLDNGSFERAVDTVNATVFGRVHDKFLEREIRRVPPEAIINSAGERHRLDRLSSGEKSLLQLFLRIGAHSTRNTWVMVDELDVHLHVRWQHKAIRLMKDLVRSQPGTTVIAATHSVEILSAYPMDIEEPGLVKGGWIIEEAIS